MGTAESPADLLEGKKAMPGTPVSLPVRGVHIDCRAQMLRFETLRRIYRDPARWGFNTVLFEYDDRSLLQRVDPPEAREPAEIGVVRVQFGLELDDNRSQVSVRGKRTGNPQSFQQMTEDFEVPGTGFENLHGRHVHPRTYVRQRLGGHQRLHENTTVRH